MTTGVLPHRRYTIHEYVQLEAYSNVRHEYFGDQIFAMAGGSPEHGTWAANIIGLLAARLRGRPCRVQTSDVRIRVVATGLDTYPDVSVICGPAELDRDDPQAITNPTILFEVLSPGTEEYDRGEKLEHYKKVPALREVVFVAHDRKRVDVVRRLVSQSQSQSVVGTWVAATAGTGESVRLESLDCDLPVDEIYRDPLAAD